ILFVPDTSGSLDVKRDQIANDLNRFVGKLPVDGDYRVGVMLGHGFKSETSGRLYRKTSAYPEVLRSDELSIETIQTELAARIRSPLEESQSDGGEMGMTSLLRGVTTKLEENRSKGFFRDQAALAVVFISDENDL